MQYLIRKKNNIDIEISKFEDDNEPLDVYTISSRGCTCPAAWRRKTCKHTRMAKFWTSNLNSETGVVLSLNETIKGLQNLKITYIGDVSIISKLDLIINKIQNRISKINKMLKIDTKKIK